MKSETNYENTKRSSRHEDMAAKLAMMLEGELDLEWRDRIELMQKGVAGGEAAMEEAIKTVMLSMADAEETTSTGGKALTLGQQFGDPVELARKALLKAVYGDVEAIQELGRRQMDKLMHELAGPNPSPLERLSAERIAFCGQQLFHYEKMYAERMNKAPNDSLGIQKEEFYQKRVARAQRNYEAAIKTLAQVRRLQLPTVQVNIADKQINVGNGQIRANEAQVNVLAVSEDEEK